MDPHALDPNTLHALGEFLGPIFAILMFSIVPMALVFMTKHFKLRTKEIELEAQLHGREAEARLQILETRQSAVEAALGQLMGSLGAAARLEQPALAEPPDSAEALSARPVRALDRRI